jgi:hypothetical protein
MSGILLERGVDYFFDLNKNYHLFYINYKKSNLLLISSIQNWIVTALLLLFPHLFLFKKMEQLLLSPRFFNFFLTSLWSEL